MEAKKIVWLLLVLSEFVVFNRATDITLENDIRLKDYINVLHRREIAYDFFNYLQNKSLESLFDGLQQRIAADDKQCLSDFSELLQALRGPNLWAWRMLDSWGSLPSGLIYVTYRSLGNFDECINIQKTLEDNHILNGQYCLTHLPFGEVVNMDIIGIDIGICIPSSCNAKTIDGLLKNFLKNTLQINVASEIISENRCKTSEARPLETLTILTIVILSIFGALMLCSTFYDYVINKEGVPLHPITKCFSARTNGLQLFRIVDNTKNPNFITCIDGIRCLSLIWIIFGHDYLMGIFLPNINTINLLFWVEKPFSMIIQHANVSVDSFFLIGGILVSTVLLRDMDRKSGKLSVPLMYIHRYLRLTPLIGIGILFHIALLPYFGNGPLWGILRFDDYDNCKRTWWKTLLYIQNYAAIRDKCLTQTWYLAVDTQLFFISPIFLIATWKWGKKGIAGITLFLFLLSACLFTTIMTTDYSMLYRNSKPDPYATQYHLYEATHVHSAPWLIGFIFGYFLHKINGKTIKLSKQVVWFGWISSLALLFTCLFALYQKTQWNASKYTRLQEASYLTLSRIAWPLGLCWVIFACKYGYGGFANTLLSSPLWQPIARLSYAAYIFHTFIISLNAGRIKTDTYFSDYDIMLRFLPDFGMTMLLSTTIYLIVEAPLVNIQLLLLPNRKITTAPKVRQTMEPKLDVAPVDT